MEQAALADAREQGLVAKLQTATREIEALKRTAKQLSEAEEEDEEQGGEMAQVRNKKQLSSPLLILDVIILPRQARGKHRKKHSKKGGCFLLSGSA